MKAIHFYRIANKLYRLHIPFIPKIIYLLMYFLFNCSIPYKTEIGEKTTLGYGGMGIVIHPRAKIGKNCIIAQQVTIGGSGRPELPVIGDYVYIGPGAKILGNVKLGDYCVVGANAVVVHDIPPRSLAVGIPAQVVKENLSLETHPCAKYDYLQ